MPITQQGDAITALMEAKRAKQGFIFRCVRIFVRDEIVQTIVEANKSAVYPTFKGSKGQKAAFVYRYLLPYFRINNN